MKQYQFTVTSQCIEAPKCVAFVSGSAEIYEAVFAFDASWDGFARTAVFECAGERREQLLVNDRCIVPWEILHAGAYMRVGVYGVDGNKTMPTVYSGQVFVARGAEPSEAAREHSPDVFDQIVEIGQQAAESKQSAEESAESAAASETAAAGSATEAAESATNAETAAEAAEEAKDAWENMSAEAQTLSAGTPATASYEGGVLTLGIPQGVKGDAGKSAYQSAQDGGYTGTEEQFNSNLAEVGDKYSKPSGGIPKTDLDASVRESLESADSALQEVPIASEDTLGGVKVGGEFDIAADGTLSIYKALTLSASVSPSSVEMGSTIDDVTVSWTLNKTPVSQSVEGVDVPVADRSKALHDLGVTANRTFAVTAADARMSLTRNPGITFYRYVYSKVGSADAAPTQASECVKQADLSAFGNNGADFSYSAGSTLWLLTTKANAQIQTNVLGQWADVTTINAGTVEFTQANGAVVTYYAYNTGVFSGTGSAKYRIR